MVLQAPFDVLTHVAEVGEDPGVAHVTSAAAVESLGEAVLNAYAGPDEFEPLARHRSEPASEAADFQRRAIY